MTSKTLSNQKVSLLIDTIHMTQMAPIKKGALQLGWDIHLPYPFPQLCFKHLQNSGSCSETGCVGPQIQRKSGERVVLTLLETGQERTHEAQSWAQMPGTRCLPYLLGPGRHTSISNETEGQY